MEFDSECAWLEIKKNIAIPKAEMQPHCWDWLP